MSQSSVIGAGTVVHGNLQGEGSLEVFGRVEGDVSTSGDVSVADGGVVRGDITAAKISVSGAVQGNLTGSEAVLLERGAKVIGDVSAPRVGIGSGALIRGHVRTDGEPAAAQARRVVGPGVKPATAVTTTFAAKPVAKVEVKAPPAPPPVREVATVAASPEPSRPKEKPPERRPPPPVLPSLGKAAKGKKKGRDE
ncbi:MAG TPA: polymer-forming cytoskeletal protein [Polyangiaceae bacterium]|nr:polymer-forming cytoskeletal protein [Polyangiaceae bacterium]